MVSWSCAVWAPRSRTKNRRWNVWIPWDKSSKYRTFIKQCKRIDNESTKKPPESEIVSTWPLPNVSNLRPEIRHFTSLLILLSDRDERDRIKQWSTNEKSTKLVNKFDETRYIFSLRRKMRAIWRFVFYSSMNLYKHEIGNSISLT